MRERIKSALEWSGMTMEEFEEKTGISRFKWGNLFTGKQRVNEDHLKAVNVLWPQFAYWISTGKVLPEAGQVNPAIEAKRKDSKRAGKLG